MYKCFFLLCRVLRPSPPPPYSPYLSELPRQTTIPRRSRGSVCIKGEKSMICFPRKIFMLPATLIPDGVGGATLQIRLHRLLRLGLPIPRPPPLPPQHLPTRPQVLGPLVPRPRPKPPQPPPGGEGLLGGGRRHLLVPLRILRVQGREPY